MSDFRPPEATRHTTNGHQPTVGEDALPQPPVLITEQEVMFGTAVALSARPIPVTRRVIGALRVVAAGLRPPPPPPRRTGYLERARLSREMGRL